MASRKKENDMPSGYARQAWSTPPGQLIDKTRERALLQIDNAKEQARQHNLKLVALIFCLFGRGSLT